MANPPRTRKRVRAVRRAPDGSAFENCGCCGVSVAIALADMHECESKKDVKRFRGKFERLNVAKQSFWDQPRSPFCFFMESFMNCCDMENLIEIGRKGFETWKNMSNKEKLPYVNEAKRVNSVYLKALLEEEENYVQKADDEANSACWKSCQVGTHYEEDGYSDTYESSEGAGILNKYESFEEDLGYSDIFLIADDVNDAYLFNC